MQMNKEESMKRGEFLRSLGLSTSTLMAFYCLGTTMTSCGSKEDDPDPTPGGNSGVSGTTTGGNINFTIDLTHASYSSLKTAGEYKFVGDVLVAFTTGSAYVALTKICTHEGNQVQYRKDLNDVYCPTHLSEFSIAGAVKQGPAALPLTAYKTSLSADGNTLTVKA
jgi:cytochrome b6-f complex iron-sulfur subunit